MTLAAAKARRLTKLAGNGRGPPDVAASGGAFEEETSVNNSTPAAMDDDTSCSSMPPVAGVAGGTDALDAVATGCAGSRSRSSSAAGILAVFVLCILRVVIIARWKFYFGVARISLACYWQDAASLPTVLSTALNLL